MATCWCGWQGRTEADMTADSATDDDIWDSLFHNADYRIMPTERLVNWFFSTIAS